MEAHDTGHQRLMVITEMYFDFSEYKDDQLIAAARSGNADALNALMERYKNAVKIKARGYFIAGADVEDTIQEGMIGLYGAYAAFDPGSGASFATFANLCVERAIVSSLRKATAGSRIPQDLCVSLSDLLDDDEHSSELLAAMGDGGRFDPAQVMLRKAHTETLRQKARELLSPREYRVLQCYLAGLSQEESAKHLNVTRKSVDNALTRIKRKLVNANVQE